MAIRRIFTTPAVGHLTELSFARQRDADEMIDATGLMGKFIFQLMLRKWHTEAKTGVLSIKLAKRGASMKRALLAP